MTSEAKPNRGARTRGVRINTGRPRQVTDAQVEAILNWRARQLKRKGRRGEGKTYAQLAGELNMRRGTVADIVSRHGVFKVPSPEARAVLIQQRQAELANQLSADLERKRADAELDAAIRRWSAEGRAASEGTGALPCAAEVARHLKIPPQSFHWILGRLTRCSQKPTAAANLLRSRRLGRVDMRCLLAWKLLRDRRCEFQAGIPSLRKFAGQLGITLHRLRSTLRRLKLPLPRPTHGPLRQGRGCVGGLENANAR